MWLFRFNCVGMVTKTDFRHISHLEYFSAAATANNIFIVHQKGKKNLTFFVLTTSWMYSLYSLITFFSFLVRVLLPRLKVEETVVYSAPLPPGVHLLQGLCQKHTSSRCCLNTFTVWPVAMFCTCVLFTLLPVARTSQNVSTGTAAGSIGLRKWSQT